MFSILLSLTLLYSQTTTVPGTVIQDRMFNSLPFSEKIDTSIQTEVALNRKWVQNFAQSSWTSKDGKVFVYSNWDEAERTIGVYKNNDLVGQLEGYTKGLAANWGDITGDDTYTYLTTTIDYGSWATGGCGVLRNNISTFEKAGFSGGVGTDNAYFSLRNSGQICALYRNITVDKTTNRLYVTDSINGGTNKVIVFQTNPAQATPIDSFNLSNIVDMVADNGKLWIIRNGTIGRYSSTGSYENVSIPGILNPTKIAISRQNEMMVWDDSLCQVVFVRNYNTAPRNRTFGYKGGIYAANKINRTSSKLNVFPARLTGMGTDSSGKIYLTWGYGYPAFTDIRSFKSNGDSLWHINVGTFVSLAGFDESKDGTEAFTPHAKYKIDWSKPLEKKSSFLSYTVDYRAGLTSIGGSSVVRYLKGRRIVLKDNSDLYGNGFVVMIEDGNILKRGMSFSNSESDAFYMDSVGNIWDASRNQYIRRYKFIGFKTDGHPYWDTVNYDRFPKMTDLSINRIFYNENRDELVVTGYTSTYNTTGQEFTDKTIGRVGRKYSNWTKTNRTLAWEILFPMDTIPGNNFITTPASAYVAADYMFTVNVGLEPRYVTVYNMSNGSEVGKIYADSTIQGDINYIGQGYGAFGWVDMPFGIQAFRRSNGEYVINFENDLTASNIIYRWCPSGNCQ